MAEENLLNVSLKLKYDNKTFTISQIRQDSSIESLSNFVEGINSLQELQCTSAIKVSTFELLP